MRSRASWWVTKGTGEKARQHLQATEGNRPGQAMRWQPDCSEVRTEWAGEPLFSENQASWKQEESNGKERRPEPQHPKRKQSWGKEFHESVEPTSWVEMKTERSHRSAIIPSACGPTARTVLAHGQRSFCLSYQQDLDDKNHLSIEYRSQHGQS